MSFLGQHLPVIPVLARKTPFRRSWLKPLLVARVTEDGTFIFSLWVFDRLEMGIKPFGTAATVARASGAMFADFAITFIAEK